MPFISVWLPVQANRNRHRMGEPRTGQGRILFLRTGSAMLLLSLPASLPIHPSPGAFRTRKVLVVHGTCALLISLACQSESFNSAFLHSASIRVHSTCVGSDRVTLCVIDSNRFSLGKPHHCLLCLQMEQPPEDSAAHWKAKLFFMSRNQEWHLSGRRLESLGLVSPPGRESDCLPPAPLVSPQ